MTTSELTVTFYPVPRDLEKFTMQFPGSTTMSEVKRVLAAHHLPVRTIYCAGEKIGDGDTVKHLPNPGGVVICISQPQ